jgi:beta-1,4-mannosyltransferase
MKETKAMKIIFIPDNRNKNSYQANLSYPLSKEGADVYFSGSVPKSVVTHWKPDILHIHWTTPFMIANSRFDTIVESTRFICELLLLKLFGVKIIWTVHNIIDHEGKFKSTELFFTKILARLCNKLIVHCPWAEREVIKYYKSSSIVVIPHGNYIDQYKNTISRSQAREKLKLSEEDIVFLYFGQIRPYKGIPELIGAFKMLKDDKAKLLIVGKPLDDINMNMNNCKDDGRIKTILEFMNAADIVVLPFKNILTSGSAILSMSFGKPIIAPAIGCITDILDDKGSFLYTEDNLFDAMQNTLNKDREILLDMGNYNFRLVKQLNWDDIGKKTYNIYQGCITG